jgi:hypothetical protein
MTTHHYLESVRHLARHFEQLRGLREVAAGLILLGSLAAQPVLDRRGGGLERRLPAALLAVLAFVGLQWLVGRYYRRRWGSVVALSTADGAVGKALLGAAIFAWTLAALLLDHRLEAALRGRPVLLGLTIASWLVVRGGRVPERRHYLWCAAATLGAGLFPWRDESLFAYLCLALGASSVVGGALDHRALLRLSRRVGEEGRAQAV